MLRVRGAPPEIRKKGKKKKKKYHYYNHNKKKCLFFGRRYPTVTIALLLSPLESRQSTHLSDLVVPFFPVYKITLCIWIAVIRPRLRLVRHLLWNQRGRLCGGGVWRGAAQEQRQRRLRGPSGHGHVQHFTCSALRQRCRGMDSGAQRQHPAHSRRRRHVDARHLRRLRSAGEKKGEAA